MRRALRFAGVALAAAAALPGSAPARQAPTLDAELLVAHPGLLSGDHDRAREDWLAALEADPSSPLAADAVREIVGLGELCVTPLDPARLAALAQSVGDGHAGLLLRLELLRASRRARFSPRSFALEGDLFPDCVSEWRVLGPLGALDHPAPMRAPLDADGPERALAESHRDGSGRLRTWRALRRAPNQLVVAPRRVLWPAAGLGYLCAWVACDAERAVLEIHAPPRVRVQVWWNGTRVLDQLRRTSVERERRFRVEVPVGPGSGNGGWNALLLRFEAASAEGFAARLLDLQGRALPLHQASAEGPLPPWSPRAFEPRSPAPLPPAAGAYGEVLRVLRDLGAGRPDRALALPPPPFGGPGGPDGASPEASSGIRMRAAWLRARHAALAGSGHLPREVRRRASLEVESELADLGAFFPAVGLVAARRLLGEDRPAEALAAVDDLLATRPGDPILRRARGGVLRALDPTGVLAAAELGALLAEHPGDPVALASVAGWRESLGDLAGALEAGLAALEADGADPGVQDRVLRLVSRAGGEDLARLSRWIDRWMGEEPGNARARGLALELLERSGDDGALEARLRERLARDPDHPRRLKRLGTFLTSRGRRGQARALLAELLDRDPGFHVARATAAHLGGSDPVELFFRAFGPDREEALAAAVGVRDASTVEALDSGMVYVFPDGSSHQRYHTITLALDRKGTEDLHKREVNPGTRLARVLKADGTSREPVVVDDAWVMPSLEPGDGVELVFDHFTRGLPGAPPDLGGGWRFASFEKTFVRSRYVIYLPDAMAGELRSFHFDGAHDTIPWAGGTVHVFLAADVPRQEEEGMRPSYEEILPWLQVGADVPLERISARWRERIELLAGMPADLAPELEAVVAGLDPGLDGEGRARALYRALSARVLDVQGSALAAHVWLQRRGNWLFLYGALLERAGVPFEWAVLERPYAPELDPAPLRAFANDRGYDVPLLRIAAGADRGDGVVYEGVHWGVHWQVSPQGRGSPFGTLPDSLAGARALVLERDGTRWESLPRQQLADSWDLDLSVTYAPDPDGAAAVRAGLRITSAQGAQLREQISQAGAAQREGYARRLAGQLVPGLDLGGFEFPGLEERGRDFAITFEGRSPRFVQRQGEDWRADLRLPSTGLSTGLGEADRTWPLALRVSKRTRVRLRVELGGHWRVRGAPAPFHEQREGYLHSLEAGESDGAWELRRTFTVRGLTLAPGEMPAFLARAAELEREEARPLRLERLE